MTPVRSPWELKDAEARLTLGGLAGVMNVRQPFAGLSGSVGPAKLRLFRVELPQPNDQRIDEAPEFYIRGQDLVSTYVQDEQRKIRAQIYWRAFERGPDGAPVLDLIVSVQTSMLDSDPTLNVRSIVQARQVLAVNDFERAATVDVTPRDGNGGVVSFEGAIPACWLFRLAADQLTYVEMVHPSDFVASRFQEMAPGEVEHSTKLFRGSLEKGVILRSRLRGVVLPRRDDVAAAIACYREFATSEPPLTV